MFKWLALFLLSLSFQLSANELHVPDQISGATNLSAEQVVELILDQQQLLIIDARKKREFLKGHIEGAVNVLNTELSQSTLDQLTRTKSQPILFYCNGERCRRSSDAVHKALGWGYTQVYWFRGGWQEWVEKRLPVISE